MLPGNHTAFDHRLTAVEERLLWLRRLRRSRLASPLCGEVLALRGEGRWRPRYRRRLRLGHLAPGLSSPLAEPLDLAAGVHDPLRAREERVADGADLGLELLARRPGRERVSA